MKGGRDLLLYNSSLAMDHGSPTSILRCLCEQNQSPALRYEA